MGSVAGIVGDSNGSNERVKLMGAWKRRYRVVKLEEGAWSHGGPSEWNLGVVCMTSNTGFREAIRTV